MLTMVKLHFSQHIWFENMCKYTHKNMTETCYKCNLQLINALENHLMSYSYFRTPTAQSQMHKMHACIVFFVVVAFFRTNIDINRRNVVNVFFSYVMLPSYALNAISHLNSISMLLYPAYSMKMRGVEVEAETINK